MHNRQTLHVSWMEGSDECHCHVGHNSDGMPLLKLWDGDHGQSACVPPPRIALEIGQKLVEVALAALEAKP